MFTTAVSKCVGIVAKCSPIGIGRVQSVNVSALNDPRDLIIYTKFEFVSKKLT